MNSQWNGHGPLSNGNTCVGSHLRSFVFFSLDCYGWKKGGLCDSTTSCSLHGLNELQTNYWSPKSTPPMCALKSTTSCGHVTLITLSSPFFLLTVVVLGSCCKDSITTGLVSCQTVATILPSCRWWLLSLISELAFYKESGGSNEYISILVELASLLSISIEYKKQKIELKLQSNPFMQSYLELCSRLAMSSMYFNVNPYSSLIM